MMSETRRVGDEKPVKLPPHQSTKTKRKKTDILNCIIHFPQKTQEKKTCTLSQKSFKTIQETVRLRRLLQKPNEKLADFARRYPINVFHIYMATTESVISYSLTHLGSGNETMTLVILMNNLVQNDAELLKKHRTIHCFQMVSAYFVKIV